MADYTVAKIPEMEPFYKGLFLRARGALDVKSFGMAVVEMPAGFADYPDHDHPDQEEVYVVLSGTGTLELENGDSVPLDPETMVRVGPNTKRKITSETDMRLLALGGVPGQAYDAPDYTEPGAPDPLA